VNYAGDLALQLAADGNHEALAANGDEVFLGCAFRREPAQRGAQALFNDSLLALLVAADAAELGRGVVGERAIRHDLALDGLGKRAKAVAHERGGENGEAGELADEAQRRRLKQRLPGGDIVGETGHGLELGGFEGRAGNLRFCGELRGIEEAADGDGELFFKQQAQLGREPGLAADPLLVGGGLERKDGGSANRRGGKS